MLDLGTPVAKFRDVARFSNVPRSNVDHDLVIDFYTPEEIGNAKTILWELYGEEMLGTIPNRQDSVNRGAHEKETDDILSALYTISNDSEPDFVKIQFVANCFSRLPRVAPEEIDLTSIVMRLTQLERNQTSLERKVASNVDNISAVMEAQFQLNGYSAVAQRQVQHVSPGDTVRRSSQPPVQPSRIALTSSQPNATAPSLTQPPLSGPVSTGPDDQPSTRDSAASGTAVESSAVDSEGFRSLAINGSVNDDKPEQTLALPYTAQMSRLEHLKRESRCANYLFSI